MDEREQLAAHLAFLAEIGISGISRDPAWRARGEDPVAAGLPAREQDAVAAGLRAGARDPAAAGDVSVAAGLRAGAKDPAAAGDVSVAAGLRAGGTDPGGAGLRARGEDADDDLGVIRADLGDCTRCKLHKLGRRQIVFGVGNPDADLMFAGEAPGRDEDIQGIPFVGRAGQLLTKMIEAMGYTREQVYIANVIKCRPPENRNPEPDEVAACEPFLVRQVESIRPRVIVALGTFAAQALLRSQDSISRLRGRVYVYGGARLIPTFHPAYLLRSPERKKDTWEDLKRARAILKGEE